MFIIACIFLATSSIVSDIPPVSQADFGGAPGEAHWIWTLIGSSAFAAIISVYACT